jgi:two-component system, sensor histidine kinase and response regulator
MQFPKNLVFPGGYMPHGYCYPWTPGLIGLHVEWDSLIALSCLSIPISLVYFTRKRRALTIYTEKSA